MRAVNLLPEKNRPRKATGGQSGSSYVVLGVLGAIVIAVLVYVLTVNSINGAKSDIASAKSEATRANAQAEALGAYGDFAKVKQQREQSVKTLAEQRLDWERLVRELAHVLPAGVWIRTANAAASAADAQSAGAASGAAPAGDGSDGPVLSLEGCAVSQNQVADTLVRLRQLQGATDVKLDHSNRGTDSADASGAGGSSGGASSSTGDCGTTHGKPNYDFQVDVTLTQQAPSADSAGSVPTRLGGGQ